MPRAGAHAVSIVCLAMAAAAFTWPIADLRNPQLPQHGDALFSVWRLAWVAHQLVADPSELFHANIFWPERNTLAMSDAMLLLGVLGAPLISLGVHPVVVHNLLLLASFVAAGYATMRLLAHLGLGLGPQIVGGVIYAFAPYRVAHVVHLELLWTAFIPLSLLALYRVLESPTLRRALMLGVALTLQALSSIYYFLFLCLWLVPATLLARLHVPFVWSTRRATALAGALAFTAVLVAPYAMVYREARQAVGQRSLDDLRQYSATPRDYFNIPEANRLYGVVPPPGTADERALFVGVLAISLVVFALARRPSRNVLAFAVLGLLALDLSLGVNGLTYNALRALLPLLNSLRAPARFGVFVLLSVAVLAAYAIASLEQRRQLVVALALTAGLLAEYWSAPLPTMTVPLAPPPVYQWLAQQPPTVTLEWPAPTPDALWKDETEHQYFSIYHWQPLVNGYSGYAPPAYTLMLERLRDFPAETALDALARNGVEVLLIHERLLQPAEFDRLLPTCADERYFRETFVFADTALGRTAACRLVERAP
jgi:hypothetical protein